jgi:hypothetical protein
MDGVGGGIHLLSVVWILVFRAFTERVSLQLNASELVAGCFRSVLHTILRLPAVQ